MTSKQIRQQFIDFFVQKHAHRFVPSSSVVPHDDPTLLFANAGMNQFKPIFLGIEKRDYVRAANSQKCIRAGGKHNDLDDVGRSRRHHTFFEMLGNWSFGDYFKRGAIEMAWELLTQVWKIDTSRLHVTVYEGNKATGVPRDDEAVAIWKEVANLPDDHIHYAGADNFWEMGETGPCGPCTEIFIDRTPDKTGGKDVVSGADPRVIEFWNLVFIQYNRLPSGTLEPLPAKHVDTGMGFERICQILQGKNDNYAIDLWEPFFAAITQLSGKTYKGTFPSSDTASRSADEDPQLQIDIAFRVIADHARMSTFAITDGAIPSNKKRGAVLRSVIRRAVRFGYQVMQLKEPFLHKLVPIIADQMGDAFPELRKNPQQVADIIRGEEADFLRTIDRGLQVFEDAVQRAQANQNRFSGTDVFHLHATLGFPSDMTAQLGAERGLTVDLDEYALKWDEHVKISGQGRKQRSQIAVDLSAFANTDDAPKFGGLATSTKVLGWVADDQAVSQGRLSEDTPAALLVDRTSFYAEQGGQAGDLGIIKTATGQFTVTATERRGTHVLHVGSVSEGHIEIGQPAETLVDRRRIDVMRNHTTTHLLNWALRKVLGDHIEQRGSLVDADKLRFDFSHDRALSPDQFLEVERLVNDRIRADWVVDCRTIPLDEAKKITGVRAAFGEKYPDPVRVVSIGTDQPLVDATLEHSVEFCGGTHLSRTGQAGFFKLLGEESVSKGVRRLTGITGVAAERHVQSLENAVRQLQQTLNVPVEDLARRVLALQDEVKQLKKKPAATSAVDPVTAAGKLLDEAPSLGEGKLIVGAIDGATDEQLRSAMDSLKKKAPIHAILLASVSEDKVSFVSAVSDELIAKGLKAGDWIREVAKIAGGSGGGRPQMAQAGGKDPAKAPEALERATAFALEKLG